MLKAGAARCVITPPTGIPILGYVAREGVATDKDGELYATALVLDDERTRVAILSFDLSMILEPLATNLRKEIGHNLGIPHSHVLLNCSHTHSGPGTQEFQYDFRDDALRHVLSEYAAGFRAQIPGLAALAAQRLSPARVGTAVGEARIGINRREMQPNGSIVLGENTSGPVDHEVRVIRVDDREGNPLAVIFAHGCHTVTMGPKSPRWSSDYIGPARDLVESNLKCLSLYLQANAGDVNPITGIGSNFDDSDAKKRLGLTLGAEVLKIHSSIYTESTRGSRINLGSLAKIPFYPRVPIAHEPNQLINVEEIPIDLPLQDLPSLADANDILQEWSAQVTKLNVEDKGQWSSAQLNVARRFQHWASELVKFIESGHKPVLATTIQAMVIGDIAVVAVPGETFSTLGLEVKRQSPFRDTLFLGYSNGCVCYIPTRDAFPNAGWSPRERYYVPDLIFQAYLVPVALKPGCGELVVQQSVDLLKELNRKLHDTR
jgi:neutral ceramidase